MKSHHSITLLLCAALTLAATITRADTPPAAAAADAGTVEVAVYYATDGDPAMAGKGAGTVPEDLATRLRAEKTLNFKHYRLLGRDSAPLDRSAEHWAKPVKPSEELMVRFAAKSKPGARNVLLDVELWLSQKKILKTDVHLCRHKPLWIRGPEWRGGHLIVAISFAPH